ncbi:MAG TPA: hypothetical protein VEP90_03360 [Methylomirabilota bacterium]|nr:hypothetical protein [Methylomirabilota bacterium]
MEYNFILLPLALGLLLPSIAIPWLVVDFLGHHPYSPLDIVGELVQRNSANNNTNPPNQNQFLLLDLTSTYAGTSSAFVFSTVVYLVSIPVIIASIVWKEHRAKIALAAGIIAITAGLAWVYSVQSFKTHFALEASSTGGLIGQEWKGKESAIIDGIIIMGSGHFFIIIAGILAIFAYVVEKVYRKQPLGATTNQ